MTALQQHIYRHAAAACIAYFVCLISMNLGERFESRQETVYNQQAILRGDSHIMDGERRELPQFQSRVLFPVLLAGAMKIEIFSGTQWYVLLRMATAYAAFATFLFALGRLGCRSLKIQTCGAGALAFALVFTFNHPFEHPTDFLDVLFVSLLVWTAAQKRRWPLAIFTLLGITNHQTMAFGAVIWFAFWGFRERLSDIVWREAIFSGALAIGSYAFSKLIVFAVTGHAPVSYIVNGYMTYWDIVWLFDDIDPFSWPFQLAAMWIPVLLWIWHNRSTIPPEAARLLTAMVAIWVLSSPIAYWSEIRSVFLTPAVIAVIAAALIEQRSSGESIAHPFGFLRW